MAKPLPPIRWLSQALTIARGRSTVFAGEGGSRKGWFTHAMQLAGAMDRKLLGRFDLVTGMRSVYFDYEQTQEVTQERWQLLALGYEVELASLGRRIGYRWQPVPTWAPRSASERTKLVDELCWHTEGLDLAIVDSVRACSPGVRENENEASGPFDVATMVTQRTGCTIGFIDHAGKPDGTNTRQRRHMQRGHSSKVDAGQTQLIFSAAKGEPTLVTCERSQRAPQSAWPADFRFTLAVTPNGGLRLAEIAMPDATEPDAEDELAKAEAMFVLDVAKNDRSTFPEICHRIHRDEKLLRAARDSAERHCKVFNVGTVGRPKWSARIQTELPG